MYDSQPRSNNTIIYMLVIAVAVAAYLFAKNESIKTVIPVPASQPIVAPAINPVQPVQVQPQVQPVQPVYSVPTVDVQPTIDAYYAQATAQSQPIVDTNRGGFEAVEPTPIGDTGAHDPGRTDKRNPSP